MSYLDALQTALAAEHAAVYVCGALGAQTSQSAEPALFVAVSEAYAAHRAGRDQLVARVADLGAEPVAAEPAYELPADLGTTSAVTRQRPARRRTRSWWRTAPPRSVASRSPH